MSFKKIKEVQLGQTILSQIILNLLALVLFGVSLSGFTSLADLLRPAPLGGYRLMLSLMDLVASLLAFILILIVHEGIHAFFFKVFAPDRPVKFGFHWYAVSASSPGTKYPKGQYIWIGLAPFVCITTGMILLLLGNILSPLTFIFLGSLHTAGCIGDFYFCLVLLRAPREILIEDTGTGMIFYQKEG